MKAMTIKALIDAWAEQCWRPLCWLPTRLGPSAALAGLTSSERERMKALEREVKELRQASAYFA
jgi:hypothetical protein